MIRILLTSELPWKRNDAITFYTCLCISRYQDLFRKSLEGDFTSRSYWFCGLPQNFMYNQAEGQFNLIKKLTLDFLTFHSNNRIKRTYKNDVKF